jgi:exosortase
MNAVPTSSLRSSRVRVWLASRSTATAAVAVTVLALALGWLYSSVMPALVRQWSTDADYSHGFFVAPLAVFFAWERRDALVQAPRRPHALGLVVLAASLVCYVAGQFGSELFLTRVSFVGAIAALVLFLAGPAHLRLLAFPIAFLLLMIPLPAIIFNRIAFPLQLFASRIGEVVIAASGIPVLREGNVLQLPGRTLEVAQACSGIRSLMSLMMLAMVLGYFTERRKSVRVLIVLAAIPIAVVANAARVAGTGLASYWISPAVAEGFFHTFSGWVMFVVALIALVAVHRAIDSARLRWARMAEARC